MNFNSILIGSENPERLVEYYTKLLGEPGVLRGRVHRLGDRLGLHHGRGTFGSPRQQPSPGRPIWNIETPDVKEVFERFKAAGRDRGPRAVHIRRDARLVARDPRGSRWELLPADDPDGDAARLISGSLEHRRPIFGHISI